MKNKFALIFFLSLLLPHTLQAYQDITCWDQDCLKAGWTQANLFENTFTDFQCYRSGCTTSGWIVGGNQNIKYYTQCMPGGCFQQGWYEIDRDTQILISQVRCDSGDCFKYGWTKHSPQGEFKTICEAADCLTKGWTSQTPGGGHSTIICKSNSCFTQGWIQSED